jgi:hypothetical protein
MNFKRGLTAIMILIIALVGGEQLFTAIGGKSLDRIYFKNGTVKDMRYVSVTMDDPQIRSRNYGDDSFGGEWVYYKRDIDSIVVLKDNFWTTGLYRDSTGCHYHGVYFPIIWRIKK